MSKADEIWTTKDGKKIKVKDMTTEHIKNTIKCIEDGRIHFTINLGWAEDNDYQIIDEDVWTRDNWIKIFKEELENRLEDNTEEIEELKRTENVYDITLECYHDIEKKISNDELADKINEIIRYIKRKDKSND